MKSGFRRQILVLGAAAVVSFGLLGCRREETPQKTVMENDSVKEALYAELPETPVYKDDEERWEARWDKTLPETFEERYLEFSYETVPEFLRDQEKNAAYSPLGLYYALALSAEGAAGETREEILKVLGAPDTDSLAEDCKAAYEYLYQGEPARMETRDADREPYEEDLCRLELFNSVWADEAVTLKEKFADRAGKMYYADLFLADFSGKGTKTAMADWVEERTKGLIRPEFDSMDQETLLCILNTIYFYDEWVDRFSEAKTEEGIFTGEDGSETVCDFMNQTMSSHGFRKGKNYTVSSLRLKNGSMKFVLPDEGTSVEELLESPETFREILEGEDGSAMGEVVWKVPKFSYGSSLSLKEGLERIGVQKAFGDADFSNLSDAGLFISSIRQECHVGIDENGVEAAAYTEIIYSGAALPEGRAEMILDRPFLYVIESQGQILFAGICRDPAA